MVAAPEAHARVIIIIYSFCVSVCLCICADDSVLQKSFGERDQRRKRVEFDSDKRREREIARDKENEKKNARALVCEAFGHGGPA